MNKLMIRGSGGGGEEEARTPIEAPDSLRSIAYARILDMLGEGDNYGFADQANPLSCMYLNETVVANPDGSLNFSNLQIESRTGTQTQDYIKGLDGVENEISVGVELRQETAWTRSFTNPNLSAVRVRLSTPALSKTDTTNGDITGYSVGYKIELSTDSGTFQELLATSITGKTSSKYERSHRIDLPPATTGWTIRVTRLSANSTTSAIQDKTFVESFAEIVDGKFRMPMTALVWLIIDAEQFSNIPSRAYHWKGRIIRVPTNYDPDTRLYSGLWDGTFQPRYSNNPAWVFFDMVTNSRYGLGHIVPEALVDKWALYKIATYCDALVPDGFGGMEPRFTANLYLQNQGDALRVMNDMASMFRGILYASGGSITAVGDMPEDPCYTYTPANVIDGKFTYSGSGRKVRHTVALVSWNDMSDFGRAKIEYVDDPEGIARYGLQQTDVIAIGCTSRGQARRLGKYILTTERYETDAVVFSVGLDGTLAAPGKIINIADPLRAGRRTGGRIRVATPNTITVDSLPVIAVGDRVTAILPNGMPEKRIVASVVGDEISMTVPFTQTPVPHSVWMVESDEISAQRFRVLGVAESDDRLGYTINAIQHVEGKFDYVENNLMIEQPPTSILANSLPAAPVITLSSFLRFGHGTAFTVINADWPDVPNAVGYEIQWQKDLGSWSAPSRRGASSDEWEGAFAGTYIARAWGFNALGMAGESAYSDPITVTDAVLPIVDLAIVGGVVTIDCRYLQFRLNMTENVTTVLFINGAPQDTLLIEVTQAAPGSHTLNFGTNVATVSGVPYVLTPTVGAIDVLGLTTNNSGITWALVAQQPLPAEGGGGSFAVTIAPSPASANVTIAGGVPAAPSVQVVATTSGGSGAVTRTWARADSGGTNFLIDDPTIPNPTLTIPAGVTDFNATQQWRVSQVDSVGMTSQAVVAITLSRGVEVAELSSGFDGVSSTVMSFGTTGPTGGTVQIRFNRNGTWDCWSASTVDGTTYAGAVNASGNWHGVPSGTVGDAYEIQYARTAGVGSLYNGASTFAALNSTRTIQLEFTNNLSGSHSRLNTIEVTLRKIADPSVVIVATMYLEVIGENG